MFRALSILSLPLIGFVVPEANRNKEEHFLLMEKHDTIFLNCTTLVSKKKNDDTFYHIHIFANCVSLVIQWMSTEDSFSSISHRRHQRMNMYKLCAARCQWKREDLHKSCF